MKPRTLAAIALAILIGLWVSSRRPKWVDDVLLRLYAADHLGTGEKDQYVANIALDYGVPVTWVEKLKAMGVPNDKLAKYTNEIIEKMIEVGPPSDTKTNTLVVYRDTVICKAVGKV